MSSAPSDRAAAPLPDIARRAIAAWSLRCRLTGRPIPDAEAWSLVRQRGDGPEERVVLRLSRAAGPDLFVKSRPKAPLHRFLREAQAHRGFARHLAGHPTASAVPLVAVLPVRRILVTEAAQGVPALRLAREAWGAGRPDFDLISRCAGWIGAVRAAAPARDGRWDGRSGLDRLRRAVPGPGRAGASPALAALAERAEAAMLRRKAAAIPLGPAHGDLHLDNLVLDGDGAVTALDFGNRRALPLGHDPARLTVSVATMLGPGKRGAMRGFLRRTVEALERGAGPEGLDDLYRAQVVADALVIRADLVRSGEASARSAKRRARVEALLAVLDEQL